MSEDTASQSRRTSPIMAVAVHRLAVLLRVGSNEGKQKLLLPSGRLPGAVKPTVNRRSRATGSCHDLRSGELRKRFLERHAEIIPRKKTSAMWKIVLVIVRNADILCACPTPTNSPPLLPKFFSSLASFAPSKPSLGTARSTENQSEPPQKS